MAEKHFDIPERISTREAAHLLGISKRTLYKLANSGAIAHFCLANRFEFEQRELARFLKTRQVECHQAEALHV